VQHHPPASPGDAESLPSRSGEPGRWTAIIGLECHAQLRTRTKLFCGCPVDGEAGPNQNVCPICLGHPGTLPILNEGAVSLALRAGVALGAKIEARSVFARKHYFYPDLPKGYQITQFDRPLCTGGQIEVEIGGSRRSFELERVHLEEDAGRMHHASGGSAVDWNRGGVPLIEIVGRPDLRSPEEAEAWMRMLHRVLVEAGVCTGDMEKGHLRCDANVSVCREGAPWGTRVEVKNVNSFRFVARALRAEIERQTFILEAGGRVLPETRTWTGKDTALLRSKEEAADYRYLPEPDLLPLAVSEAMVAEAAATLPGAPLHAHLLDLDQRRLRDLQARTELSEAEARVLLGDAVVLEFFEECVRLGGAPRLMAAWAQGELLRAAKEELGLGRLQPAMLVALQGLLDAGGVNRGQARDILGELRAQGGDPGAIADARGLRQIGDEATLLGKIAAVLAAHPDQVARYRGGNSAMLGFFMGAVMRAFEGGADPKQTRRLLILELERP
jgi:aspartyl-tRNA(Asn)/glutamyl-tRNA(Gln) amidotransferase subunit B